MTDFVTELDEMIRARKKMTSPLYQLILSGNATQRLLQTFVLQRLPVKRLWTRGLLGIAARIEDNTLRALFVENVYEEETGRLSGSERHLSTFEEFGRSVGLSIEQMTDIDELPETVALAAHNRRVCNDSSVHFTAGLAAVVLLMEGQPPIVSSSGSSMLAVMRDVYRLPEWGYEFFVHHASSDVGSEAVSELEDEHAEAARNTLRRYCDTPELQAQAVQELARSLDLRHAHFDAILAAGYSADEPVFRYDEATVADQARVPNAAPVG